MKEELIKFKTAKLAKEKGFDWETEEFYTNSKKPYLTKGVEYMSDSYVRLWQWNSMPSNYPTNAEDVLCAAPTQSLLQKWLWETHSIWVQSTPLFSSNECIGISVIISSWRFPFVSIEYDGFDVYEGLEKGLQEALKIN